MYGNEILRGALYDIWILLERGGEFVRPLVRGYERRLRHPTNAAATRELCAHLSRSCWQRFGYPNPITLLPVAARQSVGDKTELRDDLVSQCRICAAERMMYQQLSPEPKRVTVRVQGQEPGEEFRRLQATVRKLRIHVSDLKVSEKRLKEEVAGLRGEVTGLRGDVEEIRKMREKR